jgi:hypothetical protein
MYATLLQVNGLKNRVTPENGKSFSLKELQGYVGGLIEFVYLPDGCSLVINEEGKLEGLEQNDIASDIFQKAYPIEKYPINNDGLIVGDALYFNKENTKKFEEEE